jgi:putative inorganic carbon (HCO3(-)) transporter
VRLADFRGASADAGPSFEGRPLRDLILAAALLGIIPLMFRAPIVGVLVWLWVALMNPQREVYGPLAGFELNLLIAVLTATAWLVSSERKVPPLNVLTVAFLVFASWTCVTTFMALDISCSFPLWNRTIKTMVLTLMVITLANTKGRIQSVVWLLAISIGYYGVKGAGFTLLTAGRQKVFGPEQSMISDNNDLGLALIFVLPLLYYLRATSRKEIVRHGLLGTLILSGIAVFGTYSRGALVALAAAGAAFAVRSRSGIYMLLLGGLLSVCVPVFAPPAWMARMSTIQSADQDESFNGRLSAWRTSFAIAKARPAIGGGFSAVTLDKVVHDFPAEGGLAVGRAAHSIYFQVLGDHGFVGLALYLTIVGAAWVNTSRVLAATRGRDDLAWANLLARMLQVSMMAFLIGGAALSMAYYDGILVGLALTASLLQVVRDTVRQARPAANLPRWRQTEAPSTALPKAEVPATNTAS